MAQRFHFLANAPRFFAVDCSVITPSGVAIFLERELPKDAQALIARHAFIADADALVAGRVSVVEAIGALMAALADRVLTASEPDDRPSP
jgi:hypothetical protein